MRVRAPARPSCGREISINSQNEYPNLQRRCSRNGCPQVPETVPFRMTPVMTHALGVSGVEGDFAAGCRAVLTVMRDSHEGILGLLEAFVYDPPLEYATH